MFGNKENTASEEFKSQSEIARAALNANQLEAEAAEKAAKLAKEKQLEVENHLETTQNALTKTQGELTELRTQRDTIIADVAKEEENKKQVIAAREAEQAKLEDVQTHLADLGQALKDEQSKFDSTVRGYSAKEIELKAQIQEAQDTVKLISTQHDARVQKFDQEIADITATIEELQGKETSLTGRITKLEDSVAKLTATRDELDTEIEKKKEELAQINTDIKLAYEDKSVAEAELTKAQELVEEAKKEKFVVAERKKLLDEREAFIRETYIQAGVKYPEN